MRAGKTLMIEISSLNSERGQRDYYADLQMPAADYEITDALQRTRLDGANKNTGMIIQVTDCDILPELCYCRLDSPSIKELNFFATRLWELSDMERKAVRGVYKQRKDEGLLEEPISLKDVINMTYGLDGVTVVSNIHDEEALGRYVIENNLHPELSKLSNEAVEMLDLATVGKWLKGMENGQLLGATYVATKGYELPVVYDGRTLPVLKKDCGYAFRLQVAGEPGLEAQWVHLPCDRRRADEIARSVGMGKIEDCTLRIFESTYANMERKHFGSLANFDKLNALAMRMHVLSPVEKVRLKAALAVDPQDNLEGYMDVLMHLKEYEFMPFADTPDEYFRAYLQHHLGSQFDPMWISDLHCYSEGTELMERLGATITNYGIVSMRGRSLFELVPYDQEQTQDVGVQTVEMEGLK